MGEVGDTMSYEALDIHQRKTQEFFMFFHVKE